jgi:hypothetical protein
MGGGLVEKEGQHGAFVLCIVTEHDGIASNDCG